MRINWIFEKIFINGKALLLGFIKVKWSLKATESIFVGREGGLPQSYFMSWILLYWKDRKI